MVQHYSFAPSTHIVMLQQWLKISKVTLELSGFSSQFTRNMDLMVALMYLLFDKTYH